jgi:hypothetical protein
MLSPFPNQPFLALSLSLNLKWYYLTTLKPDSSYPIELLRAAKTRLEFEFELWLVGLELGLDLGLLLGLEIIDD